MKTRILIVLSVLALVIWVAFAPAAQAVTTLDFALGPPQYTTTEIKFEGGTSKPLIGTDINVYNLVIIPENTVYTVLSGKLDFQTDNYTNDDNNRWNFSSGGTLTLTGDVGYYTGAPIPDNWTSISGGVQTLASGTFTFAYVTGGGNFLVIIAGFTDTKDNTLEEYLGIPTDTHYSGNLNLSFNVTGTPSPGDAFDSKYTQVKSGDFINDVPVPASALLLGTGLLGLVGLCYRRKRIS
jgi:hypothetical protein